MRLKTYQLAGELYGLLREGLPECRIDMEIRRGVGHYRDEVVPQEQIIYRVETQVPLGRYGIQFTVTEESLDHDDLVLDEIAKEYIDTVRSELAKITPGEKTRNDSE